MNNKVDLKGANVKIGGGHTDGNNIEVGVIHANDGAKTKKQKKFKKTNKSKKAIKVFISHGHDTELLHRTVLALKEIGLETVVSIDLASQGDTIIEKIEKSSDVDFAVVLYTPCDLGGRNTSPPKLQSRARQNVVFEHGYLMAKLGRNRVFTVTKGEVQLPSNISGTVNISADSDNWHKQLNKELTTART